MNVSANSFQTVNKAFTLQSPGFDVDDLSNPVLIDMRKQIYAHVHRFLKPGVKILELNAGTGIDACYFAKMGHYVHATDLSDGMIRQLQIKSAEPALRNLLSVQQVSYDHLNEVSHSGFDFVFSNFGGLNCIDDLSKVTTHLPELLSPGAYITWVIMPPLCFWEIMGIVKGNFSASLRRFKKGGVMAHLEGQYFPAWYHTLHTVKKAFGTNFRFIRSESLGILSPQPHHFKLVQKYPLLYRLLRKLDSMVRNVYPFNRWGDHIIITFQYTGK